MSVILTVQVIPNKVKSLAMRIPSPPVQTIKLNISAHRIVLYRKRGAEGGGRPPLIFIRHLFVLSNKKMNIVITLTSCLLERLIASSGA